MRHLLLASLSFGVLVLACSKKDRTFSQDYIPAKISADAVPEISRRPTKPDGGKIAGKLAELDPEESARRKARNEIQPVTLGVGAAGITMQTTRSQARGILSAPLGANGDLEFFAEHIRIQWGSGSDNPIPELIIVDEGYPGALQLAAPFDQVKIGDTLSTQITSREELLTFMRIVGARFEQMDPKTYQCDQVLACRLIESAEYFELQFRRGGMLLTNDAQLKLQLTYFSTPQKFYPRVSEPIVYGTSVGGVSFTTTRASFEAKYGPPEAAEDGVLFYDQSSIGIGWGIDNLAAYVAVLQNFSGTMDFGATIGVKHLGESFASHFTANDDGTQFALTLDRQFEQRAADFDCLNQATPLCSIQNNGNIIIINLAKGTFVFSADSQKRFLLFQMLKE